MESKIYPRIYTKNMVQALILAGGRGERLRPITDYVPKPLIPLNNTPLLELQLQYLKRFGISDVVVCTGYKTELIQHFLDRQGHSQVEMSVESEPLGTGGAIKNAADYIYGEFYVLNGDVITDIDMGLVKRNHIASVPLRTQFGTLDIRGDNIVEFNEKQTVKSVWINAGIYRFGQDVLDGLPPKGDIERTLFPAWARQGKLKVARFPDAQWYSIDSFKDLNECSKANVYSSDDTG